MTLTVGSVFSLAGYEPLAHAACDLGSIVVLTNNANYFLVVETEGEAPAGVPPVSTGRLVAEFEYSGDTMLPAYRQALTLMMNHALEYTGEEVYDLVTAERDDHDDLTEDYPGQRITGPEGCPGCGCNPGDGRTAGCHHPEGCGFFDRAEGQ